VALRATVLGNGEGAARRLRIEIAPAEGAGHETLVLPLPTPGPGARSGRPPGARTGRVSLGGRSYGTVVYPLGGAATETQGRPDAPRAEADGEAGDAAAEAPGAADAPAGPGEGAELGWSPELPFGLAHLRTDSLRLRVVGAGRGGGEAPPFPLAFDEGMTAPDDAGAGTETDDGE
jgi:hypothetical protein